MGRSSSTKIRGRRDRYKDGYEWPRCRGEGHEEIVIRFTGKLDSLRQALDEWLDNSKKGIVEAFWEDPHSHKLEQDVGSEYCRNNWLSGSQGN